MIKLKENNLKMDVSLIIERDNMHKKDFLKAFYLLHFSKQTLDEK